MNQKKPVNLLAAVCLAIIIVAVGWQVMTLPEGVFWVIVAVVLAVLAKS